MDRVRGLLTLLVAGALLTPAGASAQQAGDVPTAPTASAAEHVLGAGVASATLFAPAATQLELATAPAGSDTAPAPQVRNRAGVPFMIAGGVLFVTGAIIGGDAGTILMIGGAAGGAYGAYLYFGG